MQMFFILKQYFVYESMARILNVYVIKLNNQNI